MPQTVVKDDNEKKGVPECTAQWIHFPICIKREWRGSRGSSSDYCRGEKFDFTSSRRSLHNAVVNPSTPWQQNGFAHFLKAIIVAFNCIVVERSISVTLLCLPCSCMLLSLRPARCLFGMVRVCFLASVCRCMCVTEWQWHIWSTWVRGWQCLGGDKVVVIEADLPFYRWHSVVTHKLCVICGGTEKRMSLLYSTLLSHPW